MRGEFRFRNGLVLPNNISLTGAKVILESAFNLVTRSWYVALVSGAPTIDMTQGDMTEPTIGVGGYARASLAHSPSGWPIIGDVNGQAYVESALVSFAATAGEQFDEAIQRMALVLTETRTPLSPVIALSAPLPAELIIDSSTPASDREFTYRIYL
jgi:hypothetical protein